MKLTDAQKTLINELLEHYNDCILSLQDYVIPLQERLFTHKWTPAEELDFNFAKHQICALKSFSRYFEEMLEFEE